MLRRLPVVAAIAALVVWPIALLLIATSGGPGAPAAGWGVLIGIALGTILSLWSTRANPTASSLALWVSGGLWAGASDVTIGILGLPALAVALLTLGAATVRERERAKSSLVGPAGFLLGMMVVVGGFNLLSR